MRVEIGGRAEAWEAELSGEHTEHLQRKPQKSVCVHFGCNCTCNPPINAYDSTRELNFNIRTEQEDADSQGWSIQRRA